MGVVILAIILIATVFVLRFSHAGRNISELVRFYSAGMDHGFVRNEIRLLWKVGKYAELDVPSALFWSIPTLDKSLAVILKRAKAEGRENDEEIQGFLSHLYSYRTKVEMNQAKYKKGITSSRDMVKDQRLRVVLKGKGVFASRVMMNTAKALIISFPLMTEKELTGIPWKNQRINVFFRRQNDASYFFETLVFDMGMHHETPTLTVGHTDELIRTQKRKSIRVACSFYAQLYIKRLIPGQLTDPCKVETEAGMRCLVEDISEKGALIRIGGKGASGMTVKIQFTIQDIVIVMTGIVKGVEYKEETNQSLLHFQCDSMAPRMRNAILAYVYNILPKEEKDILDAIRLSEEDNPDEESTDSAESMESVSSESISDDAEDTASAEEMEPVI
ncbi:MAG: PilZ domain-containing protein [Spirochaetaceae bacterium]|jgi:c-di-GMP-binding flagellar brake protein YcgR|nr:PilZ domain-containing protein [Spirochaetaceae bacterium]